MNNNLLGRVDTNNTKMVLPVLIGFYSTKRKLPIALCSTVIVSPLNSTTFKKQEDISHTNWKVLIPHIQLSSLLIMIKQISLLVDSTCNVFHSNVCSLVNKFPALHVFVYSSNFSIFSFTKIIMDNEYLLGLHYIGTTGLLKSEAFLLQLIQSYPLIFQYQPMWRLLK